MAQEDHHAQAPTRTARTAIFCQLFHGAQRVAGVTANAGGQQPRQAPGGQQAGGHGERAGETAGD